MVVLFLAALCLCFQTLVQSTSGRPAQHGAVESADGSVPNCHERASKSSAYDEARISAAVNELSDASSMHNPRFVMFFGQPRTGHSIVGSILDAHPQMAVANEVCTAYFLSIHFRLLLSYSYIITPGVYLIKILIVVVNRETILAGSVRLVGLRTVVSLQDVRDEPELFVSIIFKYIYILQIIDIYFFRLWLTLQMLAV